MKGLKANGIPNSETIAALSEAPFDITVSIQLPEKMDGPFTESIPQDAWKAQLPALNTLRPGVIVRKFHVSEVLRSMNRNQSSNQAIRFVFEF